MNKPEILSNSGVYCLTHITENIVKFGSTKNIKDRMNAHTKSFGDCMILTKSCIYRFLYKIRRCVEKVCK